MRTTKTTRLVRTKSCSTWRRDRTARLQGILFLQLPYFTFHEMYSFQLFDAIQQARQNREAQQSASVQQPQPPPAPSNPSTQSSPAPQPPGTPAPNGVQLQ